MLKLGLVQIAKEYECVRPLSLPEHELQHVARVLLNIKFNKQCPSCPDPQTCARLLDDKWRQAYQAVFRFGPCQPSMVFRYLRTLEGVSPPLALSHLVCQTTAKAFIATCACIPSPSPLTINLMDGRTVFDRMFSLGVRGSGTDTAPLGARVAAVAGMASATLPRRHFLYCSLRPENPVPPRGQRHHHHRHHRDTMS